MKKDKLWVFDLNYLEIWASTYEEAEEQAHIIYKETGMDYDLAPNWRQYQEEAEHENHRPR
jgi:hypothetical protein